MADTGVGEDIEQNAQSRRFRTVINLLTGQKSSLERLRAEIGAVRTDIDIRKESETDSPWLRGAEQQITTAEAAAKAGDAEIGWRSLLQARRLIVYSYDPTAEEGKNELTARAAAIRAEAEEKLDGWRLDAVRELLPSPSGLDGDTAGPPTPETIYAATEILDARHGNVHRRVALVRSQVLVLALVEFVGVFGILAVTTYWESPFMAAPGSAPLLVAVALFGLMGASAGRLISLISVSHPEKIPVLAINWWMTLGRTLMGAAAALAIYAFLHSGLVAVGGVDVASQAFQALVLAVAFAAGFSERLLERAVASISGSEDSQPPPKESREDATATDK